jgi:hypothetical protein
MYSYRLASAGLGVVLAVAGVIVVEAQRGAGQRPAPPPPPNVPVVPSPRMPLAPPAVMGASVTPALEGWIKNADGTTTILVGYMNRNQSQTFDVPIGPNNSIEPGGPDFGQPTHFEVGRNYGVFSVTVPKDFGTKRLTYTISVNNQPQTITLGLSNGYQIEPYLRSDTGNTPPVVKLDPTGPELKGPPHGPAKTLTATVDEPLTLTLYATDKGNTISQQEDGAPAASAIAAIAAARGGRGARQAPIQVTWFKHRGPAGDTLKFDPANPMVAADAEAVKLFDKPGDYTGKATTTATFTEAGEYWLRAQVNDATGNGGGGEQCCWSNVLIKVNVQAAAAR